MRRRVKNISYDEADYDDYDYDDYDYDDDVVDSSAKASKKAVPKAKSAPEAKKGAAKRTDVPAVTPKPPSSPTSTSFSGDAASPQSRRTLAAERRRTESDLTACAHGRRFVNLVVIGHVDAGKSTLMGHLLYKCNAVTAQQIRKLETQSKEAGKASFLFAWVMDEGEDERKRGVTVDVAYKYFETERKIVTVIDGPGHRDFIPAMILGAVQADTALLVVDALDHCKRGRAPGQEKEHLQLVRALGITRLIVAINKMDLLDWDEGSFELVKANLKLFMDMHGISFDPLSVFYTPVSAFEGKNLVEVDPVVASWTGGIKPLLQLIDELPSEDLPKDAPLHLAAFVSDVWTFGNPTTVSVKMDSGTITLGEQVLILPSAARAKVKSITCRGTSRSSCGRGEYIESLVLQVDSTMIATGSVICSPKTPLPVDKQLLAKVVIFDVDVPICRGLQVMMYLHAEVQAATIVELLSTLDKTSHKIRDKHPRALTKGQVAIVKLELKLPVVYDEYRKDGASSLSRLLLRTQNRTIAAGVVVNRAALI